MGDVYFDVAMLTRLVVVNVNKKGKICLVPILQTKQKSLFILSCCGFWNRISLLCKIDIENFCINRNGVLSEGIIGKGNEGHNQKESSNEAWYKKVQNIVFIYQLY